MKPFFDRLIAFLFLGMILAIFIAGIILFSYLLMIGAVIGLLLFIIQWVRLKLFHQHPSRQLGRTFDHQDK